MHKPFYITTPLYYVNDNPHVGHAYTTVLVDSIARFQKIKDREVFFLTGTDEHGQKVFEAAGAKDRTPQEHCDLYVENFKSFWEKLGIEYDHFIRTTDEHHYNAVQHALKLLWDSEEIYQDNYVGWYCTPCERFWTEKDLKDGKCPDCGRPVEKLVEKNYFFRMSKYQDWLIDHIKSNPDFIQPESRRNEILGFLKSPINDLCISRPKERLSWGVELPFDKDYVCYVWFDALLNYISAPGWPDHPDRFEHLWPADFHVVGKDIITTHAVYWPIMLKALGIDPPESIFAHGWWMVEEAKMGKSLGNAVPIPKIINLFGKDAFRYYLIAEKVMALDTQFGFDSMIRRINNDLANDLGNAVRRVIGLIHQNFKGIIPEPDDATELEIALRESAIDATEEVNREVSNMRLSKAMEVANRLVREINRYLENTAPWNLAKEGKYERLATVLYNAAEALRIASILYWPVIPDSCNDIRFRLGIQEDKILLANGRDWGMLESGNKIATGKPLFPRIDEKKVIPILKGEDKEEKTDKGKNLVDIEDFFKAKLVVAQVLECVPAKNADKLLLLKIDIGKETRKLVAGLAKWYTPEELIGKKIIVIENLKPAKIRGHVSEGMLLAAEHNGKVKVLTPDEDLPAGSKIR